MTNMATRVLVTSNCQAYGISSALRMLLPNHIVECSIIPTASEGWIELAKLIDASDVWVTSDLGPVPSMSSKPLATANVLRLPQFSFSGFHPDMTYAVDGRGAIVKCLSSDYHSQIVLWSWKNGMAVDEAARLFSDDTFCQLGYVGSWSGSVLSLRKRFESCDLDFRLLWQHVQRYCPFMHTFNHPKLLVLVEMAKQIAVKLGADTSVWFEPIHEILTDELAGTYWPIYPPIAGRYGITGSYRWKFNSTFFRSLDEYIAFAYKSYSDQKVDRNEILFYGEGYEDLDRILNRCAKDVR